MLPWKASVNDSKIASSPSSGGLLLSLCNLSLIGVAFSTWVYGSTNSANGNINIDVGVVVNLSEYISTPTINAFEVCPIGIVVDETICYAGEINIKTDLLLKNGLLKKRKDIKDLLSLNIEITNNGTFNFFSKEYMGSLTPNLRYSFYVGSETPTYLNSRCNINDKLINSTISYTNSSLQDIETISINIVYSFDFSNYKTNFKTQIYDNLGDSPLSFDLSVEVI